MIFLPEACDFIGEKRSQFVENAEPLNGETVRLFCQMAKGYKVWLSLGGILEKVNWYVKFFILSVLSSVCYVIYMHSVTTEMKIIFVFSLK
jgi:predicted amidohydrolase